MNREARDRYDKTMRNDGERQGKIRDKKQKNKKGKVILQQDLTIYNGFRAKSGERWEACRVTGERGGGDFPAKTV